MVIERLIVQTDVDDHAELLCRDGRHLARIDDIRRIQEHPMDHARSTGPDIIDAIVRRLDEVM